MDFQSEIISKKLLTCSPIKELVYSSETHQPYHEGCFTGVEYDLQNASENTLFIYFDYLTWIQNMQMCYRN